MSVAEAIVYRAMTQKALDAQYDQRTLVPDVHRYAARWKRWSDEVRKTHPPERLAYGNAPEEAVDVFRGKPHGAPHLHIHGGAWRAFSAGEVSFVVRGLGAEGAHVAVADFGLAPAVPLRTIVDQVRHAFLLVRALFGNAPVFVSGHSSGAHLAACLLDRTWQQSRNLPQGAVGGMVLVSGVYDLEPVRLSARNSYLHLTQTDARDLSPLTNLDVAGVECGVFWGDGELAEFRRQSALIVDALGAHRGKCHARELKSRNHFDMYEAFCAAESPVTKAALGQMASAQLGA